MTGTAPTSGWCVGVRDQGRGARARGLQSRACACAAISAAALFASADSATAQHTGDVILSVDAQTSRISTASADNAGLLTPERVFVARFGDSGFANRTTNPGFNALTSALPPGQTVGVSVRRALRVWQNQRFCTLADERIQVRKFGVTAESPAADPAPGAALPSVDVGVSGPDGSIHEHPAYTLTAPADSGVYLLEVEVYLGTPGGTSPAPSAPLWLIFGNTASQADLDAASLWVSANLAAPGAPANPCCPADFNASGTLSVQDIFDYLTAYFAGQPGADYNASGAATVQDIFDYLTAYFAGC